LALISVSVALSQTPVEAASPQTRGYFVALSACLAYSLLRRYQFTLLGKQRHKCVNDLPRVVIREAERPGLEPLNSDSNLRPCKSDALTTTTSVTGIVFEI